MLSLGKNNNDSYKNKDMITHCKPLITLCDNKLHFMVRMSTYEIFQIVNFKQPKLMGDLCEKTRASDSISVSFPFS